MEMYMKLVQELGLEPALSQSKFLYPDNPFPGSLAGDLPLVVPGFMLLEELG
jgi:hypothetical protein